MHRWIPCDSWALFRYPLPRPLVLYCILLCCDAYRCSELGACCFHCLFLRLLDWDEAMRHLQEMTEITKCRRPAPELVDVRSMQHEANRDYLPSCTVVYRCRKERGCCDDSLQCSVKTSNIIVRSFIVSCFVSFNSNIKAAEFGWWLWWYLFLLIGLKVWSYLSSSNNWHTRTGAYQLIVPTVKLSTYGPRLFAVAGPTLWILEQLTCISAWSWTFARQF